MKMKSMKNKVWAAPLALSLVFAGAGGAASAEAEFNARINIDGRGNTLTVPVDCDALDRNGNLTMEFLRPFDVFGHLDHLKHSGAGGVHCDRNLVPQFLDVT